MSKEVDALVIIGHSHLIAQEAPHYTHENIEQGLWRVRNGKTQWYDGKPTTELEKNGLFAGEVFLQLGDLATSRYMQQLPERSQNSNPFREVALEVIDEISPFKTGEALPKELALKPSVMQLTERGLPAMFDAALTYDASIKDELKEKWSNAQAVHARRGIVATIAYDASTLFQGLSDLNLDEIAPDKVDFDRDANVVAEYNSLNSLVDRAGVQPHPTKIPYYQTFSNAKSNEQEMLRSALEDLRRVRKAIS